MDNPWQVESIQAFSILKCPECFFDTKDENKFEDHAMANHPMSYVLFGKSEKEINHNSVTDTERDLKDNTIYASTFDKEDSEKYLQEENDIDIKEEPIEDLIVEPLLDKDSTFSIKEDGNWNKETLSLKHPPSYELLKKMSDEKQKFAVKVVKCSSCDFVTNCKHLKFKHCELLDKDETAERDIKIGYNKKGIEAFKNRILTQIFKLVNKALKNTTVFNSRRSQKHQKKFSTLF